MRDLGLDFNLLQALGINGPNGNKSFKSKLTEELQKRCATYFFDIGTCSYSHSKQYFLEGTKCLKDNVNVDQFAIDLHFFFKLSAVRREDYRVPYKLTDMTICLQKYFLSFAYLTWRVKCCVYNTYLLRLKLIMELMLDHLCSKCMPFRGSTLMKQCLLFLEAPLNIS